MIAALLAYLRWIDAWRAVPPLFHRSDLVELREAADLAGRNLDRLNLPPRVPRMTIVDAETIEDVARYGAGSVFVAVGALAVGDVVLLREWQSKRTIEVRVSEVAPHSGASDWVEVEVFDRSAAC